MTVAGFFDGGGRPVLTTSRPEHNEHDSSGDINGCHDGEDLGPL